MKFAIDLTWVRHKIVGGTESFVNNLIQGFVELNIDFEMVMITSRDNSELFEKYTKDNRIKLVIAPVNSASVSRRILWQNLKLALFMKKLGIETCLEPVYGIPFFIRKNIKFVTVIHDLEAIHYPKNHSAISNLWLRISWRNSVRNSKKIITISNFVRNDILSKYNVNSNKIVTIFDPIVINVDEVEDFAVVKNIYDIYQKEYYYTVSKLNPHKNLSTLVKTFGEIKAKEIKGLPCKLLISGVNGGMKDELQKLKKEYSLQDEIIITGFVENSVRNCLYKNAKAFLFPSIFEGFGMPPIEAICSGTPVITTKMACIPEITQNVANYVNNPYSTEEWIKAMLNQQDFNYKFNPDLYLPSNIANLYLDVLIEVNGV